MSQFKPVCWGILRPNGELYMSESCICEDKEVLREEIESANADERDGKCKIVRIYVRVQVGRKGKR